MTSPSGGGASATIAPAPFGFLSDGSVSDSLENTRDGMINDFDQNTQSLSDNTKYYEAERRPDAIGLSVPPEMRKLLAYVGYPRLYVDSIAERQELQGFRTGGNADADDALWDWWQANDLDVYAPLGHTEALVHGRSYITVAKPDPKLDLFVDQTVPIIRVESANQIYATIDPRTRSVEQAIRVIKDKDGSKTVAATLYLPNLTTVWISVEGELQVLQSIPHNLGVVPVIPIRNQTLLSDLTGTSQITPELRSATDAAARIMMDMQGAAELMAIPQRWMFGVKPSEVGVDAETGRKNFEAYFARILAFSAADGKAGQFSAAELMNFVTALDAIDKKTAAYTGLPPQYLSYSSQNPASAEAIKASEARLVKLCERKNVMFGGAWEMAMRVATAVMGGGMKSIPPEMFRLEAVWGDPSTPTYAAKADAASKLYAGGAGVIPKEQARIDMGYSIAQRLAMLQYDQQDAQNLLGAFAPGQAPTSGNPTSRVDAQAAVGAHQAQQAADAAASNPPDKKPPAK